MSSASRTRQPNIVFILTDDQGFWSLGCYGNKEARTPNIDRLAENGILFNSFFCTSPVCSPARASILTGRMPSSHGVHDWISGGDTYSEKEEPDGKGKVIEYLSGMQGYTDFLADAGYVCGLSGKWHLGDSHHMQKGFSFWKVHARGGGHYFHAPMVSGDSVYYPDGEYITDVFTDNAIEFLKQQKDSERPFYLSVHYTAPHDPWDRDEHPEDIFERYYNDCPFESVPDILEAPEWFTCRGRKRGDDRQRRISLSGYYAAIEAMDANVGRIIAELEEMDVLSDTIVVFTSDNGMNMGHHGIYGKGNATSPLNMFEESVRVPFIACGPGIAKDKVCNEMLSHYDFMPTILDFLGIENSQMEELPGHSFATLLRGGDIKVRDDVVICDEYGPTRMIRTDTWKYIYRYPDGPCELYNIRDDSNEEINLYYNKEYSDIVEELHNRLFKWFERYSLPDRDGLKLPVSGDGQYGKLPVKNSDNAGKYFN